MRSPRLPNPQPVLKQLQFMEGRKRALTGFQSATRQAEDEARARRWDQKESRAREIVDEVMEQLEQEKSQYYDDIAELYFDGRRSTSPISRVLSA